MADQHAMEDCRPPLPLSVGDCCDMKNQADCSPQERPHVLLLQQQLRASREALRLSLETDTVLTPEGKERRRSSDPHGGGGGGVNGGGRRGSRPLSIFSVADGRSARVSRLRNWIVRKLRAGFSSSNKNQRDSQRRRRSAGEDGQEAAASSNMSMSSMQQPELQWQQERQQDEEEEEKKKKKKKNVQQEDQDQDQELYTISATPTEVSTPTFLISVSPLQEELASPRRPESGSILALADTMSAAAALLTDAACFRGIGNGNGNPCSQSSTAKQQQQQQQEEKHHQQLLLLLHQAPRIDAGVEEMTIEVPSCSDGTESVVSSHDYMQLASSCADSQTTCSSLTSAVYITIV